ncbi:hypothetical protein Tco_0609031 [Tanacetum coccineum]
MISRNQRITGQRHTPQRIKFHGEQASKDESVPTQYSRKAQPSVKDRHYCLHTGSQHVVRKSCSFNRKRVLERQKKLRNQNFRALTASADVPSSITEKKLRNQNFRALTASADVPSSITETTDTTSTLPPSPPPLQKPTGSFKDGDGDGDTHYERSHKGVKASANSDIIFFFTSAQDGNKLLDDERLSLADDLKKAHDQNQNKSK